MTRAVVLFLVLSLIASVYCNLIRTDQDIGTKDVPIHRENVENNDLKPQPEPQGVEAGVIPLSVDTENREPKKCAKIGEYCTYHGECCTRSCLGYSRRCVTGSGLYPDYIDRPDA